MSGVSQFMEKLASLPPSVAFDAVAYRSMVQALDVQSDVRSALLTRDAVGLAERLGVGKMMFCMIATPSDDEKEDFDEVPGYVEEEEGDESTADK